MVAVAVVSLWAVFEVELRSERDYSDPFADVVVSLTFTSPSGRESVVDGFYDGGRTWRARFCPDEVGRWSWRSSCSVEGDAGLHGHEGTFECVPYDGDNPLYAHGPIRVSEDRFHFVHADGTPFFWLADTAWNGALKSKPDDWELYLRTRREQRFTAIQFVSTQWRAADGDRLGEKAYNETDPLRPNVAFFRRLDAKLAAVNAHGLVAAPIMLWAVGPTDPGQALSEDDAARLMDYMVARWDAYHVVWIPGGDGNYRGERSERWKRLGRRAFGRRHDRLVTMHPCGQTWVGAEFRGEPWFDFIGYQSGHGDSDDHLCWLTSGPPATDWDTEPHLPVVNLEPNYETHISYHHKKRFTDHHVRRAAYWSLLVAPPAGVTYGINAIWAWQEQPRPPMGHEGLGTVGPWRDGLDTPGIRSMTILRRFFDSIDWPRLRPAQHMLAVQPGEKDPRSFIAVGATAEGDLTVAYLPEGGEVTLRTGGVKKPASARWFDPRSGEWLGAATVTADPQTFAAPGEGDWLLVIRP